MLSQTQMLIAGGAVCLLVLFTVMAVAVALVNKKKTEVRGGAKPARLPAAAQAESGLLTQLAPDRIPEEVLREVLARRHDRAMRLQAAQLSQDLAEVTGPVGPQQGSTTATPQATKPIGGIGV